MLPNKPKNISLFQLPEANKISILLSPYPHQAAASLSESLSEKMKK